MFVINLGDSRFVLGERKGGDDKKLGEKIRIEMSIDQKTYKRRWKIKNYWKKRRSKR